MKNTRYNGQQLAECLTAFGCGCLFIKETESPEAFYYHFKITNILTLTPSKIKSAVYRLQIHANNNKLEKVNSAVGHFAIKNPKTISDVVYLANLQSPPPLSFVAGIDENGEQVNISLDEMVHCLVAGTTGSGKTVFLKCLLDTLTFNNNAKNYNFAIIDKKKSLNFFEKAGQCLTVGNTDTEAAYIIKCFQNEMYRRYNELEKMELEKNQGQFPKWILVIDELADLMLSENKKEIENMLVSLCQLGRAAGIHCMICTQSPRVAVVSGLIQANTPTKIIFKTASTRESVLCLGHSGAEKLRGNGDCLIKLPHITNELHLQAPFQSDNIIKLKYK